MARIRSIHPGLFSDPEFAGLSSDAQMFYLGLLTEADDNGIFEWNANKLKIRLRPLKDGPIEPLLSELQEAQKIRSYEMGGRQYGAIRNFRRFQRPKSPKAWHPILGDFRIYVGLEPTNGEPPDPQPDQFPQNGEMSPQREEEGGRRKGEGGNSVAKATGGKPPTAREIIFRDYLPWIMEKLEKDREYCATQMGVLVRDAGGDYDIALTALIAARETDAANPFTYAKGCLKPRETYEQRRLREGLEVINAYEAAR